MTKNEGNAISCFMAMVSRHPDIFAEFFLSIDGPEGRTSFQPNVGVRSAMESLRIFKTHFLYNPRQRWNRLYLAVAKCWLRLFYPHILTKTIVKDPSAIGDMNQRFDALWSSIDPWLIDYVKERWEYDRLIATVDKVYLVDEFEFHPEKEIEEILDWAKDPTVMVVASGTTNGRLNPDLRERIRRELRFCTSPATVGKWNSIVEDTRSLAIIYPEGLFFTPFQLAEQRRLFNHSLDAYYNEIHRGPIVDYLNTVSPDFMK